MLPEQIQIIGPLIPPNEITDWGTEQRLKLFGWAEGGYTGASTGTGLLNIEPKMNRYGNSWLFNQGALVLERTLDESDWSWGFRAEFYMGADAALLRPITGFGPTNPRFGTDFRQAYVSFHAPVLTDGGVDVTIGRQYVPLGYETTMAPYRPMYSLAYAWIYSQNGATTGAIATFHITPQLDLLAGVTLGVNSEFDLRGWGPSYIARAVYWTGEDKRTKLVGTVYTGPEPIAAAKGHLGTWETEVELQVVHNLNPRLTLVSETNFGSDRRDPLNNYQNSSWFGTYGMAIVHAHRTLDINFRAEWFDDTDGSRTGHRASYGEITTGINFMPTVWMNFRPEIRYDLSGAPVFGPEGTAHPQNHQWTFAFETLLKF